ncbi:MAG: carboxypeptidase-like regulatory domain-containing protein [Bacteroidetes bacterium]|nr:carboxypeptidase-like regulatory domain-containing protein [Bacteroidota bacterium]
MKTRIITASFVLFMIVPSLFATDTGKKDKNKNIESKGMVALSGTVVDKETGEALAGVQVKVEESGVTVYSDFDGNFNISVMPGSYTVTTTMISYESTSMKVAAESKSEDLKVSLNSLAEKR